MRGVAAREAGRDWRENKEGKRHKSILLMDKLILLFQILITFFILLAK